MDQRKSRSVLYQYVFAAIMSRGAVFYNGLADVHKRQLLGSIKSQPDVKDVLEIGFGTGPNLSYYGREDVRFYIFLFASPK